MIEATMMTPTGGVVVAGGAGATAEVTGEGSSRIQRLRQVSGSEVNKVPEPAKIFDVLRLLLKIFCKIRALYDVG